MSEEVETKTSVPQKSDEQRALDAGIDIKGNKKCNQTPLENAVMELISDMDFDGYLLTQFDTQIVKQIPGTDIQTAALIFAESRFFIRLVEEWYTKLTDDERVAVLKHEVAHFVNKHFARRNGRDPELFNIAGDMAINQSIPHLPKDCVKLPRNWHANEPTEHYYDRIQEKVKQNAQKMGKAGGIGVGNNQSSGGGSGTDPDTKGGSGGGIQLPNQWDTVMDAPSGQDNESETMADEVIRETVKAQLDAGISAEKLRGLHAGALSEYIEELTKPPMIDWRHALTRFAATLADQVSRLTLKRPDRRQLVPWGKRREYLPKLIICVDTSGSVSDEMLATFFSQIHLLSRRLAEIAVIIADAQVQDHFVFRKGMEERLRQAGTGRGGTDFEPAVRYINKKLRDYDGAVYLTDGWCPEPNTRCKVPMIWVVTENKDFPGRPRIMAKDEHSKGRRGRYGW